MSLLLLAFGADCTASIGLELAGASDDVPASVLSDLPSDFLLTGLASSDFVTSGLTSLGMSGALGAGFTAFFGSIFPIVLTGFAASTFGFFGLAHFLRNWAQ